MSETYLSTHDQLEAAEAEQRRLQQQLTNLITLEVAYRESEQAMLRRVGNALQWNVEHFTWEEVVEEIARLKADQEAAASFALAKLAEVAQALMNEVHGIGYAFEHELRTAMGNANFVCLMTRHEEVRMVLAALPPLSGKEGR
jgi:hypothetical protein